MHCPKCAIDINDDHPECPKCGFHVGELDVVFGAVPERTGLVMDWAKVLGDAGVSRIQERLQAFTERAGSSFFVVTIPTTAPRLPSEYVFWLFNHWNVGGDAHSGLLLLLAMHERRIEVEVGFALERFLTDEEAAGILRHHAVPFLKKGSFEDGLYHSVDVLSRLIEQLSVQEKTP